MITLKDQSPNVSNLPVFMTYLDLNLHHFALGIFIAKKSNKYFLQVFYQTNDFRFNTTFYVLKTL
jgi:hypothetical protein